MANLLRILFIFNILTYASFGATLGLDDSSEPSFFLRDNTGATLSELYNKLSGDGSTADAAITLYVPFNSSGQDSNFYLTTTDLPGASSTLGGLYLRDIDSKAYVNEEFYVAVKDNNNGSSAEYRIVKEILSESDMEAPFVSFDELCGTSELNCGEITDSISAIKKNVELVFFFMPKDTDYVLNEAVNIPETTGQSIFFKLTLSAAAGATGTASQSLISTYFGDTSAIFDYSGDVGTNSEFITRIAVYLKTADGLSVPKSKFYEFKEGINSESNQVKVTSLAEGGSYRVAFSYVDHFGFVSGLVESADFTTVPIQKLLAQNQCYLVTAGFQRQHYVLNYFRYIRDQYLLKSAPGALFVDFYYATAPKLVKYILDNKSLSFKIRALSFSIYFVLQNMVFIILFLVLLTTFVYRRELTYALQSINRR